MGGETEQNISGWTTDTLKAHVGGLVDNIRHLIDERDRRYGERFDAQEKAVNAALIAAKEAVLKAEAAAERRFESVNEFRQTLSDQARDLMPRLESEQRLATLNRQLSELTDRYNRSEGRIKEGDRRDAVSLTLPSIVFGAVGVLLGIAGFIFALVK